jgi:hypothetical protein
MAMSLSAREARDFARLGIVAPPQVVLPTGWDISWRGVPVPPVPRGQELAEQVEGRRLRLPPRVRRLRK